MYYYLKLANIMGIVSLLTLVAAPSKAGLENFELKIMRIAFMNGCVRVLKCDLEKIEYLKKSDSDMRKFVTLEAQKYALEVTKLNQEKAPERVLKAESENYFPKSRIW